MKSAKELTQAEVKALTKTAHVGKVPGLILRVQKTANGLSRSYVLRRKDSLGRMRAFVVGKFQDMTVKRARDVARELIAEIDAGGDPTERKREARRPEVRELTLADLFEWHISFKQEKKKMKEDLAKDYRSRFYRYLPSALREKPAAAVEPSDIADGIEANWIKTHESARRLLLEIAQAYTAGIAVKKLPRIPNPAEYKNCLEHYLEEVENATKHQPALPAEQVPEFFATLFDGRSYFPATVGFIAYAILTAGRAASALTAKWPEIDREGRVHTIPRIDGRMKVKGGADRQTPLSVEALEVLDRIPHSIGVPFVFESPSASCRGKPITAGAYDRALKRFHEAQGGRWVDPNEKDKDGNPRVATLHGIARASFKEWAMDAERFKHPAFPESLIERCLDHRKKYKGAYDRKEPVEAMRPILDAWGAYCFSKIREAEGAASP